MAWQRWADDIRCSTKPSRIMSATMTLPPWLNDHPPDFQPQELECAHDSILPWKRILKEQKQLIQNVSQLESQIHWSNAM